MRTTLLFYIYTRLALLLLLLMCYRMPVPAQIPHYHLQQFDYSSGIRPGSIIGLTKDHKGFLWILYNGSVQCFDGSSIIDFKPGRDLRQILCDSAGRIWISAADRVFLFDENTRQFKQVPVAGENNIAYSKIFQLPGGKTLLFSQRGFFLYDAGQNRFIKSFPEIVVPANTDPRLFAVYGHSIFFHRGDYILRHNLKTNSADSIRNLNVKAIFPISEDSAAISSWHLASYWFNFIRA